MTQMVRMESELEDFMTGGSAEGPGGAAGAKRDKREAAVGTKVSRVPKRSKGQTQPELSGAQGGGPSPGRKAANRREQQQVDGERRRPIQAHRSGDGPPVSRSAKGPGRWLSGVRHNPDSLMEMAQAWPEDVEPTLIEVLEHPANRAYQHALGPWRTLEIPAVRADRPARSHHSRRRRMSLDPGLRVEYLSVVVGPNLLITIVPRPGGPAEALEQALAVALGRGGEGTVEDSRTGGVRCSVGTALTALLALAAEQIHPTVRRLEAVTNRLEAAKPRTQTDAIARAILSHKRRLAAVGQCLSGLRDGVALLEENPPKGMGPHFNRRLRDVDRHLSEALHLVESERDQVSAILSYHLSAASNRVNEVIKTLTVLATVITPFTVISGIYGMNFAIPETHWRFGYAFALGLMGMSTGFMLWFFRRHHWI